MCGAEATWAVEPGCVNEAEGTELVEIGVSDGAGAIEGGRKGTLNASAGGSFVSVGA